MVLVNVYTVKMKKDADIVNAWDFVGNDGKMQEVIGDNMELYQSFYGSNPKTPLNPEGENRSEEVSS